MYKRQTTFVMLIIFALASCWIPDLLMAQEPFNDTLMRPKGLAPTPLGDVIIHSTIFSATLLTQFAPDRSVSNQSMIANDPFEATLLENAHLAVDPAGDAYYLLAPDGVLLVVDSALQEIARFDLRTLPVDTTNVYDVGNGMLSNSFVLSQPVFGDLDVFMPFLETSERIVLCSGISNGTPFVMRFNMPSMLLEPMALKIVLMSTVTAPDAFNTPRGIAVARDTGIALTSLPIGLPAPGTCPDAVIKFDILDPENTVEILPDTENGGFPSWGMTTDAQSNFYFTTGDSIEEPTCSQSGRARVIFIPNNLTGLGSPLPFGLFAPVRPEDVAVSPQTYDIYVTVTEADAVVRFQALGPLLSTEPLVPTTPLIP